MYAIDLSTNVDGELVYNLDNFKTNYNGVVTIDSGISHWWGSVDWDYNGFDSIQSAYDTLAGNDRVTLIEDSVSK